eukprot:m.133207 g.133207  ORF g.133207 m.133207 type:complete len:58 (+) comp22487_c0_seq2:167-340(+)
METNVNASTRNPTDKVGWGKATSVETAWLHDMGCNCVGEKEEKESANFRATLQLYLK